MPLWLIYGLPSLHKGQLLYDQTVSEWCVYLQSLQSLSYTHVPSFATYMYTFLRFRVHVKS